MDNITDSFMSFSDFGALGSFIVASFALYRTSQTSKEIFLNNLRENTKRAKHNILELEVKTYTHIETVRIIEVLQDLTLYQGYKEEKKRYLNKLQNEKLSSLYEEIEDTASCILNDCDVDTNKQQIKESINNFLHLF